MFKRPLVAITLAYIGFLLILKPVIDNPQGINQSLHGKKVAVIGTIDSEVKPYDQNMGFTLKVKKGLKGRVRVFAPKSDCQYGDQVKVSGALQVTSSPKNPLLSSWERLSLRSFEPIKLVKKGYGNPLVWLSLKLKSRFVFVIDEVIPMPYNSLLASILLGEAAGGLDENMKEDFKKTGTIHLLVVSGMNLAILIGVITSMFKWLKLPPGLAFVLATLINIIYAMISGGGASIVRASLMAELAVMAKTLERSYDFPTSAALAALVLLILDPANLFDIGFQLSFAATFSVVWLVPKVEEIIKKFIASESLPASFCRSMLAVSLAPVLTTLPIIWYNFSQISLIAPAANILILAWADLFLIIGFLAVGLGAVFLPAAKLLSSILIPLLILLKALVSFFASISWSCVYLPSPSFPLIIGYYLILIYIFMNQLNFKFTKKKVVFALSLLLCVFVWNSAVSSGASGRNLKVTVLDVGQGDSILIESPSGKKMLIDGGDAAGKNDLGKKVVLPFLHRKGINFLDYVVLTHAHSDHLGGLLSVLKEEKVGMVMDPGLPHTSKMYYKFLSLIDKKDIRYQLARAGQKIDLGDGVMAYILSPEEPFIEESELNNNSVVIKLVYGKISLLLMGDAEKECEKRLLSQYPDLRAEVIKIGHHGSRTSSSQEFLEAVNPNLAIISAGAHNKFRHPHRSTVNRLEELGVELVRTDQEGAVTLISDGHRIHSGSDSTPNRP